MMASEFVRISDGRAEKTADVYAEFSSLNLSGEGFCPDDAHVMMLVLEEEFPDWFAEHENVLGDALLCSRDDLLVAMATAPNPFLSGMVYMALVMRTQVAQITGRPDI